MVCLLLSFRVSYPIIYICEEMKKFCDSPKHSWKCLHPSDVVMNCLIDVTSVYTKYNVTLEAVLNDLHHCNGSCVCKLLKDTTGSITHNSVYNSSEHSRNETGTPTSGVAQAHSEQGKLEVSSDISWTLYSGCRRNVRMVGRFYGQRLNFTFITSL